MHARFASACAAVLLFAGIASADTLFSQGFETDNTGWAATRVPSGTGGITSASGSWHANAGTTFTQWGGYNYGAGNAVPTAFKEYTTSVDIYLNVGGGAANNTRFDYDSAINNAAGTHLSDFIFNGGFYNDATGPGANTNRFIFSASNNSQPGSAYAKNPARNPIAINTTGWYTFEHHFYANGSYLAVDMTILDAADTVMGSWSFTNTHLLSNVGGNRYGWFDYNQFSTLAFDNASLTTPPAPVPTPAAALGAVPLLGLLAAKRRSRA